MHISFTSHNCPHSDALESYALEKLAILERHSGKIMKMNVVFDVSHKIRKTVQAVVTLPQKRQVVASSTSEDMYASIDKVTKVLDAKIRKFHSKDTDHHRAQED